MEYIKKYKILIILFLYIIAISYIFSIGVHDNFMLNLMGLFFIIFSFFKVIHLYKFNISFSKYDIFGKNIKNYGLIYPFIEIFLGIGFLLNYEIKILSILTIIILTSTTIWVYLKLKKWIIIECACLGVIFGIPLSNITIFENITMIIMCIIVLIN